MRKNTIKVTINKREVFEDTFDKTSKEDTQRMIINYLNFIKDYHKRHSVSARTWHFPPVYIDGQARYKVTPNGNWDEIPLEN